MTDAWGVDDGYLDVHGGWHPVGEDLRRTVHEAMGAGPATPDPPEAPPLWFVEHGRAEPLHGPAELELEDGSTVHAPDALPPDLPLGYHDLHPDDGGPTTRLVVHPARAHLPEDLRDWVLNVQLYAARSERSWGVGDLGDLAAVVGFAADHGARMVGINPLHAPRDAPVRPPSPYSPSSRRWIDPLVIDVGALPGAADDPDIGELADRARAGSRLVDRTRAWRAKRAALDRLFARFDGDAGFEAFRRSHGAALDRWAAFSVLDERIEGDWADWPAEARHPEGAAVRRLVAEDGPALRFHAWLQWLAARQLDAAARGGVGILGDLAVGFDPAGADAWEYQDVLAPDARIGAPPDEFQPEGQDWGLPPFSPTHLRAAGYGPFVETVRANLRHASALRIDHAMGLFRLYWQVAGGGAYVRFAGTELLRLLCLESVRAGALVIGEDLGTVEAGVSETLGAAGVLSTRVLWFEDEPPERWPRRCFATATTHDLPTVAGVWTGSDVERRRAAGVDVDHRDEAQLLDRLRRVAGEEGTADGAVDAVHRALAAGPAMLVGATLDDLTVTRERPNVPGTVDELPNWRLALPRALEEITADPDVASRARSLRRSDPDGP